MKLKYKIGEYKGYPILEIHEYNEAKDEHFKVFGFGLKKAKVILASMIIRYVVNPRVE